MSKSKTLPVALPSIRVTSGRIIEALGDEPQKGAGALSPKTEQGIIDVELERLRDQGHHVTTLAELEELLDGARERIEYAKRTGQVFGGDEGSY